MSPILCTSGVKLKGLQLLSHTHFLYPQDLLWKWFEVYKRASVWVFPIKLICDNCHDEATILEIKAKIALLFRSSLTTLVMRWWKRNPPKCVLHIQSFFLCLFYRFRHRCLLEACKTMQNNSWYVTISPEKPTIWWKTKATSAGTHTEVHT